MLWEWSGKDKFGKVTKYQTDGPDCSVDSMLVHLRANFRNLEIIDAAKVTIYKPATGAVERHTFNFGIIDEVEKELGLVPNSPIRNSIRQQFFEKRKPLQSILDSVKPYRKRQ